jgi:hypothetical protein
MKRLLLLFFPLIFFGGKGWAQDSLRTLLIKDRQRQILKTNLLPILWGPVFFTSEYRLVGEAATAPWQSVMLGLSYLGKSPFANTLLAVANGKNGMQLAKNTSISGFRVQGMYRFYLTRPWKAPQGFYIGPHASYAYAKASMLGNNSQYIKLVYSNINLLAGLQCVLFRCIAIDGFAGLGYRSNYQELHGYRGSFTTTAIPGLFDGSNPGHLKLNLGMNLGVAF